MTDQLCPCGSGVSYGACCEKVHQNIALATTAEQLMRSRYSAFVMENKDYLIRSWHPETCPAELDFDQDCKWLGLKVKSSERGQVEDSEGHVSFVARYKIAGKAHRIVENSYFLRLNGHWVYHSVQD